MDKQEIINISRKIGTYETSILPYEDCCTIFDPKNPVTKPTVKKSEWYENRFDYDKMIEECMNEYETVVVHAQEKKESYL